MYVPSHDFPSIPVQADGDTLRTTVAQTVQTASRSGRFRADAGHRYDAAGLAWRGWLTAQLDRTRPDGRADSADLDRPVVGAYAGVAPRARRADAASYYEHDLTADYPGAPIGRPFVPPTLLAAVPVQTVPVGAQSVRLRFVEKTGSVGVFRPGATDIPLASVGRSEGLREMHVFWSGYAGSDWRQRQLASFAGYSDDADKARACTEALEDFASRQWLLSGETGLDSYHLGNLPVARYTATDTYGTTAVDTVMQDFEERLQSVRERTRGAYMADRLMISPRIMHRLASYQNYAAGGTSDAIAIVQRKIAAYGYTIQMVDDLRDFGGDLQDGMVFYSSRADSLKHLLALAPAPVDTWQAGPTQITAMAMISGGLVCPARESCEIHTIPVSALG